MILSKMIIHVTDSQCRRPELGRLFSNNNNISQEGNKSDKSYNGQKLMCIYIDIP